MHSSLLFFLIVYPFLAGLAAFTVFRSRPLRNGLVVVSAVVVSVGAILLACAGSFEAAPEAIAGISINALITLADYVLLFVILGVGLRRKHQLVIVMSTIQLVLLTFIEFFLVNHENAFPSIHCDTHSIILTLVVSLVGSAIALYAIPYMKTHEAHMKKETATAGEPAFFAVMLLFFGAMHGLVLTNNILHLYFFFEVTTLCSFLLIGHDRTAVAKHNAMTALWMNSIGGVCLLMGIWIIYGSIGTLDIQAFIKLTPAVPMAITGIAFFVIAGMVKAASIPFQRWLLGAMVAPTPVSGLLHSSTMVKAGVFLCLRFAPAFEGTFVGYAVAICGGFTFLAASALALGQSNGKKILAYSTISNLGLIIACAGINTPTAIVCGLMLIVFHAASKALLFLCVGTIEQTIGSRDIELMRGLYRTMPITAIIATIGVLTMILPPFGMLFGKWLAIEAATSNLLLIVMLALGSAFTVMYWARWAGIMLESASPKLDEKPFPEPQPFFTRAPLVALCAAALVLPLATPWLYSTFAGPVLAIFDSMKNAGTNLLTMPGFGGALDGQWMADTASGWIRPMYLVALLGFIAAWLGLRKGRGSRYTAPYMSGLDLPEPGTFTGPMRSVVQATTSNYYMENIFGESRLTLKVNIAAGLLLLLLLGGGL